MERIHKIIAASGLTSRRKAEELIKAGKVSVNGHVIRTLGALADPDQDRIIVLGKPLLKVEKVVYAVNKPKGVISSRQKQGKTPIVTDLVPPYPPVYPIGRLDKESEGLLLLTNDGALAQQLTHPSFEHRKVYRVECVASTEKPLDPTRIAGKLQKGVRLGDGVAKADKLSIKPSAGLKTILEIHVHEGRTHLIRRMCAVVGLKVTRLTRTKIGTIDLDKIPRGSYRILNQAEQDALYAS